MKQKRGIRLKESDLQKAIVEYLDLMGVFYFAVNNEMAGGGKSAKIRMSHFKAMGLRAGASDLVLVLRGRVVFLEVKMPKGRQSESQKRFQMVVENLGHRYEVARSVYDVERVLVSP